MRAVRAIRWFVGLLVPALVSYGRMPSDCKDAGVAANGAANPIDNSAIFFGDRT